RLVHAISELANLDDHHPDVDLRHDGVIVRLITVPTNYYGLGERDLELARQITAIARKLGVPADPAHVQTVQITIDAFDIPKVKAFWRAVLGYQERDDSPEDLVDPRGRGASIWFQKIDAPDPEVNRIHLDVWVPPDQAQARINAAIAAGGHLVTDKYAPAWWTLADAEGNLADVATATSWIEGVTVCAATTVAAWDFVSNPAASTWIVYEPWGTFVKVNWPVAFVVVTAVSVVPLRSRTLAPAIG